MICGFLDPKGNLHPCCRWEHTSKAEKIVRELKLKGERLDIGEDILLKNGWICIRTGDVYKGIRGYDGKILFITDEQQNFLKENKGNFNEYQLADIEKMLRDFGELYKWHKED